MRSYGGATELTGSTATVIMVKRGELFVANLGDSRATACVLGLPKPLTSDHNTSNVKERERVVAMGGVIKDNRVGGVLIPTLAFGDFLLKSEVDKPAWKQVISAVPQIQAFTLNTSWDFIVIATDGVWDAMSNQEMVSLVRNRLSSAKANAASIVLSTLCEEILDDCCAKIVAKYGRNSCDNMTVIIVWLDPGVCSAETGASPKVMSGGATSKTKTPKGVLRHPLQKGSSDVETASSSVVSSEISR